jgi:hypothetical protein
VRRPEDVLGLDVGGVVVTLADRDDDTSFFGTRPLETPAVPGVFETLAALSAGPFADRIHLVSKARRKVAANTRAWLAHHRFFERTGISPANLHFVRSRRDKAPVCERLRITHFVDDRVDVLRYLRTVPHRYLFVGGTDPGEWPSDAPDGFTVVETWPGFLALVRPPAG